MCTHRVTSSFARPLSHSYCVTKTSLWKGGAARGWEGELPGRVWEGTGLGNSVWKVTVVR